MTEKFDELYESVMAEQQLDEWISYLPMVKKMLIQHFLKYMGLLHAELNPKYNNQFNKSVESSNEKWAKNIKNYLAKSFTYSTDDLVEFLNKSIKSNPEAKIIKVSNKDVENIIKAVEKLDVKKIQSYLNNIDVKDLKQASQYLSTSDLQKIRG